MNRFAHLSGYFVLFIIGLGIRYLAFLIDMPWTGDVHILQSWATQLYTGGFSGFYHNASPFVDYTPVYLYVLWLAGAIQHAFGLEHLTFQFNLVTFAPAIIADLITGLLIYAMCIRVFVNKTISNKTINNKTTDNKTASNEILVKSFLIALAYLANPGIILNSSVWGQMDAVHTLLLFLALYAVSKKQTLPVYLLYGIAVLTKPQSLIAAPIFLYSAFHYYKESKYAPKAGFIMLLYALVTFLFMALLFLPFAQNFDLISLISVFRQYAHILGEHRFEVATINAYNFYALTGGNWQEISSFYALVSMAAIAGVTCMAFWLLHRHWNGATIFFTAALLFTITFVFSVRMHERFMFPTLLYLLTSAILMRNKSDYRLLVLYGTLSVTFFINCLDVLLRFHNIYVFADLFYNSAAFRAFRPIDEFIALVSFVNVVLAGCILKIGWDIRSWTDF